MSEPQRMKKRYRRWMRLAMFATLPGVNAAGKFEQRKMRTFDAPGATSVRRMRAVGAALDTRRTYRSPTELERAFLRVVTRGHQELERQIETCEIADYDPTGWCYVKVVAGPPSPIRYMVDGPGLISDDPATPYLDTILWTDKRGMLESIEVLEFDRPAEPYELFVEAARASPARLKRYSA